MNDEYEPWGPSGDEMWLSTRAIRPAGDSESLGTLRTVDERFNPVVTGDFVVTSLDEAWELLDVDKWLPTPVAHHEYALLFMDSETSRDLPNHPRLKLLGYDLTDEHWSQSTLQDPCVWVGDLEAVAARRGENGLLDAEDAKLALSLFRKAWPGIRQFSVWAMFEVVPKMDDYS